MFFLYIDCIISWTVFANGARRAKNKVHPSEPLVTKQFSQVIGTNNVQKLRYDWNRKRDMRIISLQ